MFKQLQESITRINAAEFEIATALQTVSKQFPELTDAEVLSALQKAQTSIINSIVKRERTPEEGNCHE